MLTKKVIFLICGISIGFLVIAFLFLNSFRGGSVIHEGMIEERAYAAYQKICDFEITNDSFDDSPNFVKNAAQFKYSMPNSAFNIPKMLVLDSDGSAYISPKGIGGDWNPHYLYDVQLVACIGEVRKSMNSIKCNGNTYPVYVRTLAVFKAKTGHKLLASILFEENDCQAARNSLEVIREQIKRAAICDNCYGIEY